MQQAWTIHSLLRWTCQYFHTKGLSAPRLEAEILLARVLEQDRVYLYVNYNQPVNQTERLRYKELIKRRAQGEPIAYIVGYKEFMSLKFKVNDQVLIPRPETELLVEGALSLLDSKNPVRICDIGTGSGAIAVSLAYFRPQAQIFAVDISADALTVAAENAGKYKARIDFRQGDLTDPIIYEKPFDIITANLPYISTAEYGRLPAEVKKFEPQLALLSEGDGLEHYRRLIPNAYQQLKAGGYLLFEIGHEQGAGALELMQEFAEVQLLKDYSGLDRIIKGRKGFIPHGD